MSFETVWNDADTWRNSEYWAPYTINDSLVPEADGWIYADPTIHAPSSADIRFYGVASGTYEIQVRTFDNEDWSPYSASVSVSVPATIAAGSSYASVSSTTPAHTARELLSPPSATGTAKSNIPFTLLPAVVSGTSSYDFYPILNGNYEVSVKTYDNEDWSPFSEPATLFVPATIAAGSAHAVGSIRHPSHTATEVINIPSAVGVAKANTPYTVMPPVTSGASSYTFTPTVDGTLEVIVKTFDGEDWSPWSAATTVVVEPDSNVFLNQEVVLLEGRMGTNHDWHKTLRYTLVGGNWIKHRVAQK